MSEQQIAHTQQDEQNAAANVVVPGPLTGTVAEEVAGNAVATATSPGGRVFVYNGQEYPDPDPELTADQVRRELARFVPELTNADVREERRADGTTQYVFAKRLGTKGVAADAWGSTDAPTAPRSSDREEAAAPDNANARLIALIGAIPETRLEIFRLAHALILPNGEFDLDAGAARGEELERAGEEAHRHARATAALRDVLLKLPAR